MKLIQTIRKKLAILYFLPNQPDSWFELIKQHWMCFLTVILSFVSLFMYLIYVAETINEFVYSMFFSTVAFFIFVSFTSSVFKTHAMFMFISHAEDVVNERECKAFHIFQHK